MTSCKLELNDNKTEVIIIASPYYKKLLQDSTIRIDSVVIIPKASVRNIDVIFYENMSMANQVSSLCKTLHYHLQSIGHIQRQITYKAYEKLVHALITSRIYYRNSCLYRIPEQQTIINCLQMLLCIAPSILTLVHSFCNISSVMSKLHWLPAKECFGFKILLLNLKPQHGLAPYYLSELIQSHVMKKLLWSENILEVPGTGRNTFGDCAITIIIIITTTSTTIIYKGSNGPDGSVLDLQIGRFRDW